MTRNLLKQTAVATMNSLTSPSEKAMIVVRRGDQKLPIKSIKIGPGKYKENEDQKKIRVLRRQNKRLQERLEKCLAVIKSENLEKKIKGKLEEDKSEEVVFTNSADKPTLKEKKSKLDKVGAPSKKPRTKEKKSTEITATIQQLTKKAAEGLTQLSGAAVSAK